jgi:hypothetical protein
VRLLYELLRQLRTQHAGLPAIRHWRRLHHLRRLELLLLASEELAEATTEAAAQQTEREATTSSRARILTGVIGIVPRNVVSP